MENNNQYKKNRGHAGEGTKKYPADRNFAPTGDRAPRGDRPYGDRPQGDRPYGKRPYEGKPRYSNEHKNYHKDTRRYEEADRRAYESEAGENRSENRYDENRSYENRSENRGNKPYTKKPYDDRRYHEGNRSNDRPRYDARRDEDGFKNRSYRDNESVNDTEDGDEELFHETEGLVIGRNAVRELLHSDRTIDKLLVRRGDREGSIVAIVAEAVNDGIPVVEVDKSKLDSLAGFVPHQGVIAMVAQKAYCTVEDILAIAAERNEKPFIVIADGITDPYNLGALIRCAEGVGAHGIIIPRRRAVGLTALVAKSSAGAMEHMAVAKVSNIHNTIQMLQKQGVWVYAAEAGGKAYFDTDFTGPVALVMGSEGDGVSRVVKEACDGIVSIPMFGKVNSFNVSTAAAVILAEISRQQRKA